MIITLLIVIVVLLIGVLALMLTGWPGRERKEIEKTGRELRRELAQHDRSAGPGPSRLSSESSSVRVSRQAAAEQTRPVTPKRPGP